VDPDADNESDSDGDEDWQYIKVEPSKEVPCDQLLPQHQAEQLPLPVDPEEEKQDEPKPVLEDELASEQPTASHQHQDNNSQLGQFNNAFELSTEVEPKLSSKDTEDLELNFNEKPEEKLAEEAFTSEVKLTIGDLAQESSEFEDIQKPTSEELQFQVGESHFGEQQLLAEEPQKRAEEAQEVSGGKQVPSNLDLQVMLITNTLLHIKFLFA